MKQLLPLILLILALNGAYSQSKNPATNFIIPNAGFENWHNVVVSVSLNYDDLGTGPSDNWLGTLNPLLAVPQSAGGPGPVTVYKSTDKYAGTYAAKAISKTFIIGPTTIFIPGMIGTAILDMAGVRALLGKPCADCRPTHFKGYYKFEPVNGDSCAAVILLSKWNTGGKKRDTIGYGKMVQHNAVNTYTQFDIPVSYRSTAASDSMTLLVVSSAGFNVINFMGSVGQVGNTMYVDELSLEYPAVLNLGPDQTVYGGDTVTLDAGQFLTYKWSTGSENEVVKIDSSGVGYGTKKVYCRVTNGDGAQSDTVLITFQRHAGIGDIQAGMNVSIQPNPVVSKQFTVTGTHAINAVEIVSIVGKTVYSETCTSHPKEVKVTLNNIPGGIYLVRISYGNNQSVVSKIVVQ